MNRYQSIEELLARTIGLEPETIGRNMINNESEILMKSAGVEDRRLYLNWLVSAPEEMEKLIERIIVPETWFFRDREAYRFLKHCVKERLSKADKKDLNILSVPCSTGEEPYSIAMTLLEEGVPIEAIHIDAVDISPRAIRIARRGRYGAASFRGERKAYQDRYFTPAEGGMQLVQQVSDLVLFRCDNLMRRDFMTDHGPYHMVFCKNLLIYLTAPARQVVFANLDRLLVPGGILFTGHSELTSFLQWGYEPAKHARSFACIKPASLSLEKRKEDTVSVKPNKARIRAPSLEKRAENPVPPAAEKPMVTRTDDIRGLERKRLDPPLVTIRRLADKGALDEASSLCECYLKENGADKEGYYLMGLICQALNRSEKAEMFLRKALYLDPSYYDALLHMSLICSQRGDQEKAAIFKGRMRRIEEEESGKGGGV